MTSLENDGPGTLREQILASEQTPAPTINFAVSGVITVTSPLPLRSSRRNGLTIDGGGQITISGGGNVRVFEVAGLIVVKFINLTIADGHADLGGGIRNNGQLTLVNVRLQNNTATIGGGAIYALDGILTVDSCTFDGNHADPGTGVGGAIYSSASGRLYVVNSTFANNGAARGGAVLHDSSDGVFYSTTIAGNTALAGGGLFLGRFSASGATFDLKNLIVAGNDGGNCGTSLSGPLTAPRWNDLGGNISYPDNTCPGIAADAKLGPLTDNGGPTPTMELLAGSAAIDHAPDCRGFEVVFPETTPRPLATDQRGAPRPQGSACDSGAFESSSASESAGVTVSPTTVSPGGNITVTFSGVDSGNDWLGWFAGSIPNGNVCGSELGWRYSNCIQSSGIGTQCQLQAPGAPGTYQYALFANDSCSSTARMGTAATLTVSGGGGGAGVTVSPTTAAPGLIITVTFSGVDSGNDWLGWFAGSIPTGNLCGSELGWRYSNCTQSPGIGAQCQLQAPASPGTYQYALFADDSCSSTARMGTAATLTVSGGGGEGAGVTVSPTTVSPGQSITVTFSGVDSGNDWLGWFAGSVPSGNLCGIELGWRYSNCTQSPGIGTQCQLPAPASPGTYQYALFADDSCSSSSRIGTTATLTVQ